MRLKSIIKKSIRSLIRNKGSYAACTLVLSLGIAVFISMFSILIQIREGILAYYEEAGFADVFVEVAAISENRLDKIKDLDGIQAAEGILTKTVRAEAGDSGELITVKLVGVNAEEEKQINQYAYQGNALEQNSDIWLGKAFYEVYQLTAGHRITLQVNGQKKEFTIQGIVTGPEYITTIAEDSLIPDERSYTIGYVNKDYLESLILMPGMVNEIGISLENGYEYDDISIMLEDFFDPYGIIKIYPQKDQISNYFIMDEIGQITTMGTVLPAVFLIVTFIMIYIMLKRLIEQERGKVGTFKAFGYTGRELACGYLLYGLIVGVLGFAGGVLFSYPFGQQLYSNYQTMYSLPDPNFMVSGRVCAAALAVAVFVSLLSVMTGVGAVMKIRPAEAMRAAAPKVRHSRFRFRGRISRFLFNNSGIMALRSMLRNRMRSALIIVSVISAFTIINVVYAMGMACDDTVVKQPMLVERYQIKAGLQNAAGADAAVSEVMRIDGVTGAEGILVMPVQLVNQNQKESVAVYGLPGGSDYYKIRSTEDQYYQATENGIILNTKQAQKLGVRVNDQIELRSPYLKEDISLIVIQVIEEAMGPGCYMELSSLSKLFYDETKVNTLLIRTRPNMVQQVQEEISGFPAVSSITNQARVLEVNRRMLNSLQVMIYIFIIMAALMGFGAIYNISKISLAEKSRELATMRILGYRIKETAAMNSFEQWMMLAVGILIGFIPTSLLKDYIASLFSNDYYTLSVVISVQSTAVAVLCCMLAVILSNQAAKKVISRYQLAAVLRERE